MPLRCQHLISQYTRCYLSLILVFLLVAANISSVVAGKGENNDQTEILALISPAETCGPEGALRDLTLPNQFINCDGCRADSQPLGFEANFFGTQYSQLSVVVNGYVSLQNGNQFWTPVRMADVNFPIIAPFFADVDLRGSGIVSYGQTTVDGSLAYAVTYEQVGYYNAHGDKRNTFQIVLIDRSQSDFDIEFNYKQIQWETGDFSGGVNGFGGNPAIAGYSAGDHIHYYEFPGSGITGGLLDTNLDTGLIHHSAYADPCGRYVVSLRQGNLSAPPSAAPDSYPVTIDTPRTVNAPGVLVNDSDPYDTPLTAVLVSSPSHGDLNLNSDGSFSYLPDSGYTGPDSFEYQAQNSYFSSDPVLVSLQVQNHAPVIPEGPVIVVTMSEDGEPVPFDLTLDASDADQNPLNWSIEQPPANGAASLGGDQTSTSQVIDYAPSANYFGSDSFIVQVDDGNSGIDQVTVQVTIEAVNDPPVIAESSPLTVVMDRNSDPVPFALTLHAADVDQDLLTWSISKPPSHGQVLTNGTGPTLDVGYTPNLDFIGDDSLTIKIADPGGLAAEIEVEIIVQQPSIEPATHRVILPLMMNSQGN
jgi:hypothetical protein